MFPKADPFVTSVESVGFVRIDQLGPIWFAYFVDQEAGLFARMTFGGNDRACDRFSARIITPDEIQALHDAAGCGDALELSPIILPDRALCEPAGVVLDWVDRSRAAIVSSFLIANMGGRPWAEHHDAQVRAQLAAWDGVKPVVGIGKTWTRIDADSPAPDRAYLMGWWNGKRWTQPRPEPKSHGPHAREEEHDYGTTSLAVWDSDPMEIPEVVAALRVAGTVDPYTGQTI